MLRFVMLVAGLSLLAAAAKFPSYITKCARNDPELSKCALASARAAKDNIVRGDLAFRLQPMDPLRVSRLRVEQAGSVGLNITLTDISVSGLAGLQFTDNFNLDLAKQVLAYEVFVPRLELNSDYEMKGKILILPISGKGKANVTMQGTSVLISSPYQLVVRANGKEYLSFQKSDVTMKPTKAFIDFSNLFNGDPILGPQTNLFINENWKEIIDDVGPSVAQGLGAGIKQNVQGFVDRVPFDELVPEKL